MNGLLHAVDALCHARDWEELFDLADACEDALDRGKQLWPISDHIDYRIALQAPGEYAAQVITPESRRFAHGPLTEVAASSHKWAELADHLDSPQTASYVAAQAVVVEGDAVAAASAVAGDDLRIAPLEPDEALQRIAWAAAGGGAH